LNFNVFAWIDIDINNGVIFYLIFIGVF